MKKLLHITAIVIGIVMLLERAWKHITIIRFFQEGARSHRNGGSQGAVVGTRCIASAWAGERADAIHRVPTTKINSSFVIGWSGWGGRGGEVGTVGSPVPKNGGVSHGHILVSILQPILSGDPTLGACLEQNLRAQSHYEREFLWLVDNDDDEGRRICKTLIERYPEQSIRLLLQTRAPLDVNPKMAKLIAGAKVAQGAVLCVLDDDTMLPDFGLEQCLPYLDSTRVGLSFGLPYYVNFANFWSRLVAYFVNSNSLLTYIPYTVLMQPVTINGMFYAMKREVFTDIGGFTGIEHLLADDFAIAQRVREHGYTLAQTPLRHAISTQVNGPRPYLNLIQRWFIFPRESLLRYLTVREQGIVYSVAMVPALFPLLLLLAVALRPSRTKLLYAFLYFSYNFALFVHLNRRYLHNASPLKHAWLVPLIQLVFPLQLLVALFAPQKINWRGHLMRVEKGGKFIIVQPRTSTSSRAPARERPYNERNTSS